MDPDQFVLSRISRAGIIRTLFLAMIVCATIQTSVIEAQEPQVEYNAAIQLYKTDRWDQAARQFEKFLKTYPRHEKAPTAQYYLGLTYINQREYQSARKVLREYLASQPRGEHLAQANYRVGECSYLLDDWKSALPELKTFLDKFPQDKLAERARPYLGDVQLKLGDANAALATFERAIQDFPEGLLIEDARFGRAKSLEILQRTEEAVQEYQKLAANEKSPRAADAQFQLAACRFEAKQFEDAIAAYRKLLEKFPENTYAPAARINLGYALFQNGQFEAAAQQFTEAQGDAQNLVTAQYWRGLSLKSLGKFADAAQVLSEAEQGAGTLPLAEAIHFQRAVCARQMADVAVAYELFLQGVETWPQGEYADDGLHAAAELAVEAGDLPEATKLLNRFAKDYPASGLRLHHELLQGRVELAEATAALKSGKPPAEVIRAYQRAEEKFTHVMQTSTLAKTQGQARYYLALSRQLQNRHEETLRTVEPLVEDLRQNPNQEEFAEALLIQAESLLYTKEFDQARKTAETYLSQYPQRAQVPRALFLLSVAGAQQAGDTPEKTPEQQESLLAATTALQRMLEDYPNHPLTPIALMHLAERAEKSLDWPAAIERYSKLVSLSQGNENQAFAIRGLAWSYFKQKDYQKASEHFERVVREFPRHQLIPECLYYWGESLREEEQHDAALSAYTNVFQQFGPTTTAAPGAEQEIPLIYAYRGGLQRARTLRQLKKPVEADEAYANLIEKFPKPLHLDSLLDEWALLNYETENFTRADEIFRRILKETPDSPLADDARLSLAESDLLNDRLPAARQAFEQLLASNQSDADVKERALYQLLALAVSQKRWADVRQLSGKLRQDFPQSSYQTYAEASEAESLLANAKATADELKQAKELLQAVLPTIDQKIAKDAFEGHVWVLLAEIAYREQDYPEVLRVVQEFKEAHPESDFLYQAEEIVGRSYKQQADFPEARAAFERVLNDPTAFRTPTAAKCQFLIAETYFLEEKWDDAFLAYQKVYSSYQHPEWQAAALLQSGKCDEQQQNWKEAVSTYERLLKEFPNSEWVSEAKQRLEVARPRAKQ